MKIQNTSRDRANLVLFGLSGYFDILTLTLEQKKNLCDFCSNNGLILTEKLSYDVDESDRFKYYNGQVKYTYKGSMYYICEE